MSNSVISLPNAEDEFSHSIRRIESEISNYTLHKSVSEPVIGPPIPQDPHPQPPLDSSPDTPQPMPYDLKPTWFNGIWGCLRPMLNMIGKTGINEINGGSGNANHHQDDWEIPFEQITNLEFLGSGGQGMVFSGKLQNEAVAVKKVLTLKDTDIKNLRRLNHPNIVKFRGVCTQPPCYSIVMEFCPYGPLCDLLKRQKNVVTTQRVVSWAKQITSGMHYLHTQKIIHRDLKSPNVLIGDEEIIKISDFGTSRTWNGVSEKMSFAGTVAWMAPEAIQEMECSEKVDIWSFGIVLWELLTCEVPYDGMEQSAIMYLVGCGKLRPPIPKTCPEGFKLIMEMCWKFTPRERPSFKLIQNHLQIASVEILGRYETANQFFKTQESWKEEIKSQITQFKTQLQKHRLEIQLKEEQLIKKRENEIKHVRDIRELYDRKLEKVEQLYLELSSVLNQVRGEQRPCSSRKQRRNINPFSRKGEARRKNNTANNNSTTTPSSPEIASGKKYTDLPTDTTKQPASSVAKRQHYRTSSGSPRIHIRNNSSVMDAGTQTDSMDLSSENDLSPVTTTCATEWPKRVMIQEIRNGSDSTTNNNLVQLHYLGHDHVDQVEVFTRCIGSSRGDVAMYQDRDDVLNSNDLTQGDKQHHQQKGLVGYSSDDNLDMIDRKVSALMKIDNGNIMEDFDVLRKRCEETAQGNGGQDSTEDVCNDEFTSGDDDYTNVQSLRRKSLSRRPIYPGRRSARYKSPPTNNHHHRHQASDEGNTSECSVSPSSRASTLESNPDKLEKQYTQTTAVTAATTRIIKAGDSKTSSISSGSTVVVQVDSTSDSDDCELPSVTRISIVD